MTTAQIELVNDAMQALEAVIALFNQHKGPQAILSAPEIGKAYSEVLKAKFALLNALTHNPQPR